MEVSGKIKEGKQTGTDSKYNSFRQTCDPCKSTEEIKTARFFCLECNEYLCNSCTNVHRKLKVCKDHRLVGYDEMPTKKSDSDNDISCTKHDGKGFDYFCKNHNAICCIACATIHHRQCDVEYINDLVDRFEESDEYMTLRTKMEGLGTLVKEQQTKTEKNVAIVEESAELFLKEVKKFRKEITALLVSRENELLKTAREVKNKDIRTMSELTSDFNAIQKQLNDSTEKMDSYCRFKQRKQLVIASKLAEAKLSIIEQKIGEFSSKNNVTEIEFIRNETFLKNIIWTKNIGAVELKQQENTVTSTDSTKHNRKRIQTMTQKNEPLTDGHVSNIHLKHERDACVCSITGSIMMDDEMVALADNANRSVKVVDLGKSTIISYIQIEARPWDITYTEKHLVITVPDIESLIFLNYTNTLSTNKKIKVDGECQGLDFNNNDQTLIISFTTKPGSVKFYNLDGALLKSFLSDSNGKSLFSIPFYVALSHNRQAFYISDWGQDTVIKFGIQGDVVTVYKSENLKKPRGVAVDKYCNVYIAGSESQNVCVLKYGQSQLRSVLSIEIPQSIALCNKSDKIVVSQYNRNTISVYRVKRRF